MDAMRRAMHFLVAVVLILVATAATAQNKSYTLALSPYPSSIAGGGTAAVTFTVTNNSPVTNSNFNSFKLTAPAGVTITSASVATPGVSANVVVAPDKKSVSVLGINPSIGRNGTFSLSMALAAACGGGGAWGSEVWSGSTLNGQPFFNSTGSDVITTITTGSGCSLQFVPGRLPQNATLDNTTSKAVVTSIGHDPIAPGVQVRAMNGTTVDTTFNGPVTLTFSGPTGSSLAGATANAVNGIATFGNANAVSPLLPLTANKSGSYTVQATASGYITSASTSFLVDDGVLACGESFDGSSASGLTVNDSGYAAGSRNPYNKDGASGANCVVVNYDFQNHVFDTPLSYVKLAWDTAAQPYAAFSYTVTWKTETVDTTGWPVNKRPQVAWKVDTLGNPIYVPALACIGTAAPAPYGTLSGGINATVTQISVTATAPLPATPFPIVIGTERMKVTAVSGTGPTFNLTVVRGDGQTTAATHADGSVVMSTPLPVDLNPASIYFQQQVHMCVYEHGWTAVGTLDPATGLPQVRFSTSVFDIGDGWLSWQ